MSNLSTKEQYARYRASQELRAGASRPSHVPRELWTTHRLTEDTLLDLRGYPVLSEAQFSALLNVDKYDDETPYYTPAPAPGIPESEADLGAVVVARELARALRAMVDGTPIGGIYRAKVAQVIAMPAEARRAYIISHYDLRPEWLDEIIRRRYEYRFVFGDVPTK